MDTETKPTSLRALLEDEKFCQEFIEWFEAQEAALAQNPDLQRELLERLERVARPPEKTPRAA